MSREAYAKQEPAVHNAAKTSTRLEGMGETQGKGSRAESERAGNCNVAAAEGG